MEHLGPTAAQGRVVACLVEKAQTTPDSYPLTSNALRAACNQSTNRDPVVDYSERDIDARMLELREMGMARTVTGSGHRVGKHKHVLDEHLGLDGHELAVLAILILRGPQTCNEIVTRTERYTDGPGGDRGAVDAAIDRLAGRPDPLAVRRDRQPGEREPRIDQCWVAPHDDAAPALAADIAPHREPDPAPARSSDPAPSAPSPATNERDHDLAARVATLETALAEQTRRLDQLREELGY